MTRKDFEAAIIREVENWPGVTVDFAEGGKHPRAKFTFEGNMLAHPYASTPSDAVFGIHSMLGDMRRVMKRLGAVRDKPEPSKDEDEAPYRKPNDGREKREGPVHVLADPKPDIADQLVAAGAVTLQQAVAARKLVVVDDDGDADESAARETREAALLEAANAIVDGIYFGLDEDVYHKVARLSPTGLKQLCISPGTFWKDSWLDPNPTILTEEQEKIKHKARVVGRAYHCARLEPAALDQRYVREINKGDFAGQKLITSDAAVKAALKELGVQQTVTGESTLDRAERLRDAGHEGPIWSLEVAAWRETVGDRTPIDAKTWEEIRIDMERIASNPDVAELLEEGAAEVSIFWTDPDGFKMKTRIDWLDRESWSDFKTFANPNGKELDQAIADAIRYSRYHVQAVVQRDAIEAIRTGKVQIIGDADDAARALVAAIQMRPGELACWYIFQEKGGIPNLIPFEFEFFDVPLNTRFHNAIASDEGVARHEASVRRKSELHHRASNDIWAARRDFALYSQAYTPGQPWAPLKGRRSMKELPFNQRWLEGQG